MLNRGEMTVFLAALFVPLTAALSAQGRPSEGPDPHVLGAANAKVTIVEFGDYQCPVCRAFWQEVEPRLRKEYVDTGKVKLIFADFPIVRIHPEAILAAMAVDCAGDQHKYWQYHDKVFREQGRDDEVFRFGNRDLKKWARDIGLEASTFNECLDSGRHKDDVARDKEAGDKLGIRGTPTFLINNRRVIAGAQPYPIFKKAIDDELKLAGESGK
jgi:protein-disulfide isomerase